MTLRAFARRLTPRTSCAASALKHLRTVPLRPGARASPTTQPLTMLALSKSTAASYAVSNSTAVSYVCDCVCIYGFSSSHCCAAIFLRHSVMNVNDIKKDRISLIWVCSHLLFSDPPLHAFSRTSSSWASRQVLSDLTSAAAGMCLKRSEMNMCTCDFQRKAAKTLAAVKGRNL